MLNNGKTPVKMSHTASNTKPQFDLRECSPPGHFQAGVSTQPHGINSLDALLREFDSFMVAAMYAMHVPFLASSTRA
jgi:hypothetical protein